MVHAARTHTNADFSSFNAQQILLIIITHVARRHESWHGIADAVCRAHPDSNLGLFFFFDKND